MWLETRVGLLLVLMYMPIGGFESSDNRGPAVLPGDFIFGALFSVHHQPKQKRTDSSNIRCGEVREMYGIQRIEVTFQTVDEINRNPNILPNITLGVEIRDSCWYAPVALQQSIELIRDSISPNVGDGESCHADLQTPDDPGDIGYKNKDFGVNSKPLPTPGAGSPRRKRPLIGVIGPGSSSVSMQVQNLLQLFHIPQVGYSATSRDLSDKSRFNYFMRVVPGDFFQAQVMVDVVRKFNWTYVSVVNTDENYGQSGIQAFRELAEKFDVCIAREDSVLSNADDADFNSVILNLVKDDRANVVVCFCEGMTVRGLLAATKRMNMIGRLLFIGSDGWADRSDVIRDYEAVAHGSFSIRINSPYIKTFDSYYHSLKPGNNTRNPWFKEFWQVKFDCKFRTDDDLGEHSLQNGVRIKRNSDQDCTDGFINGKNVSICDQKNDDFNIDKRDNKLFFNDKNKNYGSNYNSKSFYKQSNGLVRNTLGASNFSSAGEKLNSDEDMAVTGLMDEFTTERLITTTTEVKEPKYCTGEENLNYKYKQDSKLSFVIKAIYTLAYGLHSMQQDICGRESTGICPQMYPFNGSLFKSYLMNVSFSLEGGDAVEFDSHGDPPGRYDIINYQKREDGSYDYVKVGDWYNGTLILSDDLQFGPGRTTSPNSVCSKPCEPGYYKNFQEGGQDKRCCWMCVACKTNEVLVNETTCDACALGTWPDTNKTQCNQIPVEFVTWSDTQAIIAMVFSCVGFLSTGFGFFVFVRYNNTPVVKSSTRELSYLILAGMTFSHAATFAILAKPSEVSCSLSRTMPGISFAMIYASLLTKTNRIARILAGSKKRFPTRKPRFMSATSQILITCFLIGLEVGFAITMLIYEPAAPAFQYPTMDRVMLVCNTTPTGVLSPLAFNFFLIILCTVYALKTRNVPENFNEAKFIGFAMYTTCVIWVAFVPIYFGSETKVITMCMCVTLSALVTFLFLFIPKLYIILLRPERNNRALFTTSKSIRCHIGSRVASEIAEKSSFSSSCGYQDWKNNETETTTISVSGAKGHVNWKDQPAKKTHSLEGRKPAKRTLSCQTGNELLQLLLQAQLMSLKDLQVASNTDVTNKTSLEKINWSELDASALLKNMNNYSSPALNRKNKKNLTFSPNLEQDIPRYYDTSSNEINYRYPEENIPNQRYILEKDDCEELNNKYNFSPPLEFKDESMSTENEPQNDYSKQNGVNTNDYFSPILKNSDSSLESRAIKARIREESASESSLADIEGCQMKNITISLGSITSINNQNCANGLVNCVDLKTPKNKWSNSSLNTCPQSYV